MEAKGPGKALECAKRGAGSGESPPTPTHGLRTTPSVLLTRPHCGGRGEDCGNPLGTFTQGSSRVSSNTPKATSPPVGIQREKGQRVGGAPSRNPHAARRQPCLARGIPAERRRAAGVKGGGDRCSSLRVPDGSGQVQSPSPAHTHCPGSARHDPP